MHTRMQPNHRTLAAAAADVESVYLRSEYQVPTHNHIRTSSCLRVYIYIYFLVIAVRSSIDTNDNKQ